MDRSLGAYCSPAHDVWARRMPNHLLPTLERVIDCSFGAVGATAVAVERIEEMVATLEPSDSGGRETNVRGLHSLTSVV
jgi:hypothetical protein